MEEFSEFNETKKSNFNLKAEIYKYLAHWKWLLLGVILGGLIAFLYNRYTIPEYSSEASMMVVDEQKSMMSALPSGGGFLTVEETGLGNQIETLKSKRLVENVVDQLDHNVSYYSEGNVLTVEDYKNNPVRIEFFTPDSIVHNVSQKLTLIPQSETTFVLEEDGATYNLGETINFRNLSFTIVPRDGQQLQREQNIIIRISPISDVVRQYTSSLEIFPKGDSKDILTMGLTQESSEKSEDFLNQLMFEFNEDGMRDKREVSERTAAFVQERLEIITEELDSVEGGMANFKRENRIMNVTSGAEEFRTRSSAAEQEIFNLETQLVLLEEVGEILNSQEQYGLLPQDLGINEGGISSLITSYNTIVLERNALLRNSTPEHPTIQRLTNQLDSLQDNLEENIRTTIRSINVRLEELGQRERTAQGLFTAFPGLEKSIRGIERQQQIKEQLYLFLLQRREEAAISSAATSVVAKVIDPAFTYDKPVGPSPMVILIGGLVAGLLIPIIVIFVKNMADNKIHNKMELQEVTTTIPFIGEIPEVDDKTNAVVQKNDRSLLAESFRILRTNLNYLIRGRNIGGDSKVIFVTSTIKGEGKTFMAYNLARTIAQSDDKVLLVGADIRNPQLHRYAKGVNESNPGLSEYLYDPKLDLASVITKEKSDDIQVDVLLSGRIPPNPAELLSNERMGNLLEEAKQHYDYIIVDTAPTLLVTDTLLISPYADTTLYVTRAGFTDKGVLDFVKELYEEGKIKGMALMVNAVDFSSPGYGSRYGQYYKYGYGTEQESWLKRLGNRVFSRS